MIKIQTKYITLKYGIWWPGISTHTAEMLELWQILSLPTFCHNLQKKNHVAYLHKFVLCYTKDTYWGILTDYITKTQVKSIFAVTLRIWPNRKICNCSSFTLNLPNVYNCFVGAHYSLFLVTLKCIVHCLCRVLITY